MADIGTMKPPSACWHRPCDTSDFSRRRTVSGDSCRARATAETVGPTGVEMEALCAVQVALLTIYDMCKAVDRGMVIEHVRLLEKRGGRSGHWKAGG